MFKRSATGVCASASTACASFSTGADSPVSDDSSQESDTLSKSLPSAATLLPDSKNTTSPTTSSCCGTYCTIPSRTTLISMPSLILFSASNALALRPSITTVSTTDITIATKMPIHSYISKCPPFAALTVFTASVITHAKKSRISIGSVDASQMRRSNDFRFARVNSFLPNFSPFSLTCSARNPTFLSDPNASTVSCGVRQ